MELHCCQAAKGPGDDVRAVGSDIQAGQVVLHKGTRLGAAEIGILATVGASEVQVWTCLVACICDAAMALSPFAVRLLLCCDASGEQDV